MSKNEYIETLANRLSKSANDELYINITKLAKALGVSRERAALMVFKLRYISNGNEKLFLIYEVAIAIYDALKCDSMGGKK